MDIAMEYKTVNKEAQKYYKKMYKGSEV